MERTDLIRHYAAELDRVVKAGTVGDYTYVGLLSEFAGKLLGDGDEGTTSIDRWGAWICAGCAVEIRWGDVYEVFPAIKENAWRDGLTILSCETELGPGGIYLDKSVECEGCHRAPRLGAWTYWVDVAVTLHG